MSEARLYYLVDNYLFGLTTQAELAELEQLVLGDPDVGEMYWKRVNWHSLVREFSEQNREAEKAAVDEFRPGAASPPPNSPAGDQPAKSPVLGFLGGVVDYVNHSRRLMFLLIAGMLCGWFVFQIGSVLLGRWWAGDAQVADHVGNRPGAHRAELPADGGLAGGPGQARGDAVAWLSGSVGARWQAVGSRSATNEPGAVFWEVGTEFTPGQRVNLVAGLGEITFRSGAKAVVSAPAQFSVTSALATNLQLGKLTVRVPHDSSHQGATGFTVNTPAGSVVDLGTEFGVEVTSDRKLDVQVFVGQVKVNSSAGDGGDVAAPGVEVAAGHTAHVEPGHPATVAVSQDKNRFQRDLKIASDSRDKQIATYLDLMRDLKPVVWLRMEGKDAERTIHDEMGHAADGTLQWDGPGNPFVSGAVGKSLWLRGPKLKDCALIPDYPQAEHDKLSVSAWVFADSRPNWAMIAANWGDTLYGQFHFSLLSESTDEGLDLSIQITQRDGKKLTLREGATHPFPLNEWQHVAFVADGTTLRLYREGREVGSLPHDGLHYPAPMHSLGIGAKTNDSGTAISQQVPANWSGKLDEIAIFNDALTPEQIKKLAAAPPR